MKAIHIVFLLGLLIGFGIAIPGSPTTAHSTSPKKAPRRSHGSRRLTGDDARRTEELDKAIDAALNADRWDGATARANELVALWTRTQRPNADGAADQSADTINEQALNFYVQGKYAEAQPLFEKALEIRRRLLTDDHRDTATSYNNLAGNLNAQGKYNQAQPLFEKALEIRRRLLTDDHPDTAASYNKLAANLNAQGKYTQAQPLFKKGLEIRRRLLTDDHPDTAASYDCLANNLNAQGKPAEAEALCKKALEINRRQLGDNHPLTARRYNSLAVTLNAQGKYAQAHPLFEKAHADPSPSARRRPPRHRPMLQQRGGQPLRPGEVRPGPAAL